MRSALAVLFPVLAGGVAYAGLALGATPEAWSQSSMLLLPAMLVGLLLVGLVFLPLWSVLARKTSRTRQLFIFYGAAIWVLLCAALVALHAIDLSGGLQSVTALLVPGLIVVATFGILMDPRRVRGSTADRK
jgi:hypothetical protein